MIWAVGRKQSAPRTRGETDERGEQQANLLSVVQGPAAIIRPERDPNQLSMCCAKNRQTESEKKNCKSRETRTMKSQLESDLV